MLVLNAMTSSATSILTSQLSRNGENLNDELSQLIYIHLCMFVFWLVLSRKNPAFGFEAGTISYKDRPYVSRWRYSLWVG